MYTGGMNNSKKQRCPQGHLYSEENTYRNPQGHRECRQCRRLTKQRWAKKNPDRVKEQVARTYQNHLADRQTKMRAYYSENKVVLLAQMAEYRRDHPDEIRTANQLYKQLFPEKVKASEQATRAKKPEQYRIGYAIQRHKRRNAPGHCSPDQLQARIDFYGGKCWMCGAPWEHIDHVKPISKGGSNWPANLRPACEACNLRKSDQWPFPIPGWLAESPTKR